MSSMMMFKRFVLFVFLIAIAGTCAAQDAASSEKQKLVQKVLALWHLEDAAVVMVQRPAADAMQQARIALLESPVKKKFEQMLPQFERAFGEKIAAESRAAIDPKLQAMTQSVGLK